MRLSLTVLLCALALPASAQIYKYTDARGNTVFTNEPPAGTATQTVNLPPINSIPAAQVSDPNLGNSSDTEPAAPYSLLKLSGIPNDDAALRANNGDFTVNVQIEPPLMPGQQLRLVLDGKPYGEPSTNLSLPVTNLDRGEHSLAVQVIRGNTVIQQSATDTFTIQRISIHSPSRQTPIMPRPAP